MRITHGSHKLSARKLRMEVVLSWELHGKEGKEIAGLLCCVISAVSNSMKQLKIHGNTENYCFVGNLQTSF